MDYSKIKDETVKVATGKTRAWWFRFLDRWGAKKKGHNMTTKRLESEYKLSGGGYRW